MTPPVQAPAAPAPAQSAAAEKAAFTSAMAKAEAAEPKAEPVKQSPPEVMWDEGRKYRESKERQAADVAKARGEKPAPAVRADVPRGTSEPAPAPVEAPHADDIRETEQFQNARHALMRSGMYAREVDAMDPDLVIKRGEKRAVALAKDDEAHRVAKEARESQQARDKSEKSDKDAAKRPAPKPLDLKPITGKLKDALGLDDAGAETLRESFEQFAGLVSEATAAPLRDKLTEFETAQETRAKESEAKRVVEMLDRAQADVGKSIPDVLDPDTFPDVVKEAVAISASKQFERYANPHDRAVACLKVAATNLGLKTAESASKSEERDPHRDSRSTVSARATPRQPTGRDADWKAYQDAKATHGL